MTEYLRTGKRIGIIGGNAMALMLGMQAKLMGFDICIMDPRKDCPANVIADQFIQADYIDISAIERLGRTCDVVTYTVNELDVDSLSALESRINLPQTTDLLSLTQDKLLLKGFLVDCGLNVLPYSTIVQMTDIEEAIDGIGYPCVLSTTRGDKKILLEDPSDLFEAMDIVKDSTCVLEATLPNARRVAISVANNDNNQVTTFPVVENIYQDGILKQTLASETAFPEDLKLEIERISRLIAEKLDSRGVMTVEFLVSDNGLLFIDTIKAVLTVDCVYANDVCEISLFEAHLRSICNWPQVSRVALMQDNLVYYVLAREFSSVQRQIQQKANWKFYFYTQNAIFPSNIMGHISIPSSNIKYAKEEFENAML